MTVLERASHTLLVESPLKVIDFQLQVLERLIVMIAPITPHLAEEIFYHSQGIGEKEESPSLFTRQWIPMVIR